MRNRSFTVLDSSAGAKKETDLISSKSSVVTWAIPGEVEDRNNVGPSQKEAIKVHFRSYMKLVRRHLICVNRSLTVLDSSAGGKKEQISSHLNLLW